MAGYKSSRTGAFRPKPEDYVDANGDGDLNLSEFIELTLGDPSWIYVGKYLNFLILKKIQDYVYYHICPSFTVFSWIFNPLKHAKISDG